MNTEGAAPDFHDEPIDTTAPNPDLVSTALVSVARQDPLSDHHTAPRDGAFDPTEGDRQGPWAALPPPPRTAPTLVELQARWWLWLVPAWLRSTRGEEIVATIVDLVPPGAARLPRKLHRDLIRADLAARRRGTPPFRVWAVLLLVSLKDDRSGIVASEWRPWLKGWLSSPRWRRGLWLRRLLVAVPSAVLFVATTGSVPAWGAFLGSALGVLHGGVPRMRPRTPIVHPRLPLARAIEEMDEGWRSVVWQHNALSDDAPDPATIAPQAPWLRRPNIPALLVLVPSAIAMVMMAQVLDEAGVRHGRSQAGLLTFAGVIAGMLVLLGGTRRAARNLRNADRSPTWPSGPNRAATLGWMALVVGAHSALAVAVWLDRSPVPAAVFGLWCVAYLELTVSLLVLWATLRLRRSIRLWDLLPASIPDPLAVPMRLPWQRRTADLRDGPPATN